VGGEFDNLEQAGTERLVRLVAEKLHQLTLKNGGKARDVPDMLEDAREMVEAIFAAQDVNVQEIRVGVPEDALGRVAASATDLRDIVDAPHVARARAIDGVIEIMVLQRSPVTVKIDANRNHGRPHLHVDLGREFHAGSYAIDSGERLAGRANDYDDAIRDWIRRNKEDLLAIWHGLRSAGADKDTVERLRGSDFD
jgi:hypothetical protein